MSDLHAAIRCKNFTALSVEYLYYHACRFITPFDPHSGVTLAQILYAVENDGQPEESQWPYLDQLPADLADYKPPVIVGPIHRRTAQIRFGSPVDKIAEELYADRPTMLVFRSTEQFVRAQPNNPVPWSSTDSILNPHAVVAVALGDFNGQRCVKVRNSWGTRWADAGHAWLTEEYISKTFITLVGMV